MSKILQENEDFKVEHISWQGRPAVRKSVQPTIAPGRAERLQNEAYGMGFLSDLAQKHPEVNLYIPQLYEVTSNYLIKEYIEAQPIATPALPQDQVEQRLDMLAQQLANIDRIDMPF
jgi:hypothetical protein